VSTLKLKITNKLEFRILRGSTNSSLTANILLRKKFPFPAEEIFGYKNLINSLLSFIACLCWIDFFVDVINYIQKLSLNESSVKFN
jgi:hypothetical protein